MKRKTKYVLCGLSTRGIYHFALPLLGRSSVPGANDFRDRAELAGILDIDPGRIAAFNAKLNTQIPGYRELPALLAATTPDVVLVATPDYAHAAHVVGALAAGCEVICEKPMVINCEQARAVRAAEQQSGKYVRVTFNYRYTPTHIALKRMLRAGQFGRITNVEFAYNLDTFHGASYFYRWNSRRARSGGLNIHKCCHHFDLINWWLDDWPETVVAFGALNYYGPHGAHRPRDPQGHPLPWVEERRRCPYFQQHYAGKTAPDNPALGTGWDPMNLPYDVQYPPDQPRYIYDQEIDIEDTYSALVRYRGGASLAYSCNFSTPWEGYILGINGTGGRVEIVHHSNPDPTGLTAPAAAQGTITYYPLFGGKEIITIPAVGGGHDGADDLAQRDLFVGPSATSRELNLMAGSEAGAYAVAMGEAVARSIQEHRPLGIEDLLAGNA